MSGEVQQQARRLSGRTKLLAKAIQAWMLRRARKESAKQIKRIIKKGDTWKLKKSRVSKAADPVDKELAGLLRRFGVAQAQEASIRIGSIKSVKRIIDPQILKTQLTSLKHKSKVSDELRKFARKQAKLITGTTMDLAEDSINRILANAAGEQPMPSAANMAARIHTAFHGSDPAKIAHAWNNKRAMTIARTQLAQAENIGSFEGYKAVGVERLAWFSKQDGRSGIRHHEEMDGQEVDIGENFITPLGNELKHPGDPSAPLIEVIRCRCGIRAVLAKGKKQ